MGYRRMLSDLDEGALRQIAEATGGKFFRASDTDTIESAFKAIDRVQKIEFQAKSYVFATELFWWFAAPASWFLLLGAIFALPSRLSLRGAEGSAGVEQSLPNAGGPATAAGSLAANAAAKARPGPLLLIATIVLVGADMWLGYTEGIRGTKNVSYAAGMAAAPLLGAGLLALLFSIAPRFRNSRSCTKVVFWSSLVMLIGFLAIRK
jgi:hypothetical protein